MLCLEKDGRGLKGFRSVPAISKECEGHQKEKPVAAPPPPEGSCGKIRRLASVKSWTSGYRRLAWQEPSSLRDAGSSGRVGVGSLCCVFFSGAECTYMLQLPFGQPLGNTHRLNALPWCPKRPECLGPHRGAVSPPTSGGSRQLSFQPEKHRSFRKSGYCVGQS